MSRQWDFEGLRNTEKGGRGLDAQSSPEKGLSKASWEKQGPCRQNADLEDPLVYESHMEALTTTDPRH